MALHRTILLAAALCVAVLAGCGDDADPDTLGGLERGATVGELLRDPGAPGRDVVVTGTAYPVGRAGLVLAGAGGAAIFVDLLPSEALKVDAGEEVSVAGNLNRQDGGTAIQLETQVEQARTGDGGPQAIALDALAQAPVGRGEPYVENASISGEGPAGGADGAGTDRG